MDNNDFVLGIDIGSVSISVVLINQKRKIIFSDYKAHNGQIKEALINTLNTLDISKIKAIATTTSTPEIINCNRYYNDQISIITISKELYRNIGSILFIGGEKFGLILFDEKGNYSKYKTNTSCAAGTGSFLDQQAVRLNLLNIEELSNIAYNNKPQWTGCKIW